MESDFVSIIFGWLLHIDTGCIICNWYEAPGGPFGPFGAAAAVAAAAAAVGNAINNMAAEANYAEDMAREDPPHSTSYPNYPGLSTVEEALDPDPGVRFRELNRPSPYLQGPPLPPRPPGQPPEV